MDLPGYRLAAAPVAGKDPRGARGDQGEQAADHLLRRRRRRRRRLRRAARVRHQDRHSRRDDPARLGLVPQRPLSLARHARDARHGLLELRDQRGRPAPGARRPLRRPRDRASSASSPSTAGSSTSISTPPRSTRTRPAHIAVEYRCEVVPQARSTRSPRRATGATGTNSSTPGAAADPMTYDQRDDAIMPQYVIDQFSQLAKGEFIMTTGVGQHQMWAAQWTKFTQPRDLDHLRRARLDGLRPSRRDGRPGRLARRPGRRRRRRRQLRDEHPGTRDAAIARTCRSR